MFIVCKFIELYSCDLCTFLYVFILFHRRKGVVSKEWRCLSGLGCRGTRVCLEAIPNPSEEGGLTLSCSFGEA